MKHNQKLTTENTTFLIKQMAATIPEDQFLRELVQNSIEAGATEIEIAPYWPMIENRIKDNQEPIYKLSVVDNGKGMTPEEMMRNLGRLSAGSKGQSVEGNYGVGAKITALAHNPTGLLYLSWTTSDKNGYLMSLKEVDGEFVIEQLDNGMFWAPVPDSYKPNLIKDHGTMAVLIGKTENEDSFSPERKQGLFAIHFLNNRYFDLPKNVTLKIMRILNSSDKNSWPKNRTESRDKKSGSEFVTITGLQEYLQKVSVQYGILTLVDANIHWFVIRSGSVNDLRLRYARQLGQTAILWKNEIYHQRYTPGCLSYQQQFGITAAHSRIALIVEPNPDNVISNLQRTRLLIGDTDIEATDFWRQVGMQFAANMPEELQKIIEEEHAKQTITDTKSIHKRIKKLLNLLNLHRYKESPNGKILADGVSLGGQELVGPPNKTDGGNRGTGGTEEIYKAFESSNGTLTNPLKGLSSSIEVRWISIKDGTRDTGYLDDRAATFDKTNNLVTANWDYRGFQCYYQFAIQEAGGNVPGVEKAARQIVQSSFAETVIGYIEFNRMITSPTPNNRWTLDEANMILSDEALTGLCGDIIKQLDHISNEMKKIRKKLALNELINISQPEIVESQQQEPLLPIDT